MLKLLSLFTGGSAPLIIVGALLLATNTGTAYFTHKVDSARLEQFKAAQAKQAALDNAKAIEQINAHALAANNAIAEMLEEQAAREAELKSLRTRIAHAPKTRACVDSPAIRALVDGLRQPRANHRN